MKNKKADFTMEEVVKILLAVISITALIFLAAGLYGIFTKKTDLEQARKSLDEITEMMKGLEEGGQGQYLVVAPKDWILFVREKKLCMCDKSQILGAGSNQEKILECMKNGACEDINYDLKISHICSFYISECIEFNKLPATLFLDKEKDSVSLNTKEDLNFEESLGAILEYKKDSNSKTLEELFLNYFKDSKSEIKEEIKISLETYFNTLDIKEVFGVERKDFGWELETFRIENERKTPIFGINGFGLTFKTEEVLASKSFVFAEENYENMITIIAWKGSISSRTGM